MIDLIHHPLVRLTLLFAVAAIILVLLRRLEPGWRIALVRGVFVGGLLLLITSVASLRIPIPGWITSTNGIKESQTEFIGGQARYQTATETLKPAQVAPVGKMKSVDWKVLAITIWLVGAATLLARLAITVIRENRIAVAGSPASENETQLWHRALGEAGVPSRDLVIVSEPISPHLRFNGALVIPEALRNSSDDNERLVHLFRHEAAHLRAGDQFWFPFVSVMTAAIWFHPIAWWLSSRHLISCEEARDAEAARLGGTSAYQSSIASIALGLLPISSPAPSLLRKQGRIVQRLQRLKGTVRQRPPRSSITAAMQVVLVVVAILIGSAIPTTVAGSTAEQLLGMWRAEDRGDRFARQVEVYEWGGEIKLRIWNTLGSDTKLKGATVSSFDMTAGEFAEFLSENNFVSCTYHSGFSVSTYTLSTRDNRMEILLETHYTDDSGRSDLEHTSYFIRGKWEDFESTF